MSSCWNSFCVRRILSSLPFASFRIFVDDQAKTARRRSLAAGGVTQSTSSSTRRGSVLTAEGSVSGDGTASTTSSDGDDDDHDAGWVELTVRLHRANPHAPLGFMVAFRQAKAGRSQHPTVKRVEPSSGAEASGLRAGDTIISVDGDIVSSYTPADLITALSKTNTTLAVRRRLPPPPTLSPLELKRKVAEKGVVSPPPLGRHPSSRTLAPVDLTITVDKLPDAPCKPLEFGMSFRGQRCFVSKAPSGEDEAFGGLRKDELKVGDEIIAVNGHVLATVPRLTMAWLTDAISKRKVVLSVRRDPSSRPGDCSVT